DRSMPILREPEYGHKLARLSEALHAAPERPLVLVFGSSRTQIGLRPEVLADLDASEAERPLVFNFAFAGCGPLESLIHLRRLLALGIHPRGVVIELLPAFLSLAMDTEELPYRFVNWLTPEELTRFLPYSVRPGRLCTDWADRRLVPSSANRRA